jgi:exodeoxyribonuclease VII large subunit
VTLTLPLESPVPADDVWTVSQVTTAVRKLIERGSSAVWVRGEVLQCKAWSSGHWYFTLRDPMAQIRCCMWRQNALKAGKPPADGTEVYAFGVPGLYEQKGEFQFVVTTLVPTSAVGAQQQELERVKALLQKEGLFDPARKRRLPELASRIAVVTSSDGAALRDIITVTRRRWPLANLVVVAARVQGDGSAADIARALRLVNRIEGIELCIVGRGGGAREDLAAFNDEGVCRALAAVKVPTISAVGHETDVSLTDLVADLRAATPSAAAEAAVADRRDVLRKIDDLATRLGSGLSLRTSLAAERLERTYDRMTCAMRDRIAARRTLADRLGAELHALSPLAVLQRGYAVPSADGRVLKRAAEFAPGRAFTLRVADGTVPARVETTHG